MTDWGFGVVAVVQDHPVPRQAQYPHPGPGGLEGSHAPDDLLPAQSQLLANGHRYGGGIGHVLSWSRDCQSIAVLSGGHRAGDPLHPVVRDLRDPYVAIGDWPHRMVRKGSSQALQQSVVPVQDGQPAGAQVLKDLALGLQDALAAAQIFDVGVADIGDHGDIRPHHLAQIPDLPKVVHACLDHRRLMLRRQAQEGQGRADVVVEILRRFQHPELRPSTAAIISLVVVFPTEPVICTKGMANRSR